MPGETDLVTYRREGRIAYLTLSRPEKLNAISDDTIYAMRDRLAQYDADQDAWVAIMHGEGRAFSAGADVRQRQLRQRPANEKKPSAAHLLYDQVNWKPVIAAVHGYCFGAGLGWALTSDLLVAAEGTKFQITEVSRGLSGARLWRILAEKSSFRFADEVAITGRVFTATEAAEAGVLTRLAADGEHLDVARELAEQVLKNPPLAVRLMVRARRLHLEPMDREYAAFAQPYQLHSTEDFKKSAQSFVDKTTPIFEGR